MTIDLNTGEITGGQVGAEGLGVGVSISASKDGGLGVGITLQIPFTPIELELGFGFPPKKKPKPTPTPTPTPTPNYPVDRPPLPIGCVAVVTAKVDGVVSGAPRKGTISASSSWGGSNVVSYESTPVGSDYPTKYFELGQTRSEINVNFLDINNRLSLTVGYRNIYERFIRVPHPTTYEATFEQLQGVGWTLQQSYEYKLEIICPPPPPSPSPSPSTDSPPFPNPPPRKNNKMDTCCQETLKFLRAIYKGLGIAKFPGQLPSTIIQEITKEGEEPAEPPQVPIADFVDLLDWQFRRDDERWGQWEVQIDVKDADVTTEGDQKKQVKFPNLAESIAEIEGQILSLTTNTEALIAITAKSLVESGLGRQEAIKSYLAAKSIIKYMAFETTEIDVDIPACYTPGAESIDKLVDESTIHFKGIDYVKKETLRDIYLDLLQSAAIIRAVDWERIDTKKDVKNQVLERLMGIASLANSVKDPVSKNGSQPNSVDNFEDFIDKSEDGFRTAAGITNAENPYGRTPDRRPRIRQIGENISQAGNKD